MDGYHIDSFDENYWSDLIDCSSLLDDIPPQADACWNTQLQSQNVSLAMDASLNGTPSQVSECTEKECPRKREHINPCGGTGTKACRERMRRVQLNARFSELSSILEPGRPLKIDQLAILGDTIKILNQLKNESQEYMEMNGRLLEEIKNLKAEKNELREEKQMLKVEKERIEQQMKILNVPPVGFVPAPPAPVYAADVNKLPPYPSYGFVPLWHYFPPSANDASQDHELWPPAA